MTVKCPRCNSLNWFETAPIKYTETHIIRRFVCYNCGIVYDFAYSKECKDYYEKIGTEI